MAIAVWRLRHWNPVPTHQPSPVSNAPMRLITAFLLTAAVTAHAQSPTTPPAPTFAVASIKPSAAPTGGPMFMDYGSRPGGQWVSQNAPLILILREAHPGFSLPGQVVGGPDWINTERFDINARAEGNPPADVITAMLRQVLFDRFRLRVHIEQREMDVYALVPARADGRLGPGLRKAAVDCRAIEEARKTVTAAGTPPAQQTLPKPGERPQCGIRSSMMNGVVRIATGATPISAIEPAIQQTLGRPVLDRTGLTGRFDIDIEFGGTGPLIAADQPNAPASVFTAVQEQLGLKLESRKEKMDVLVVDQVEMPTPN